MASVTYSAGIDHVSGALAKPKKDGQHTCEKMLLATHRTAATTSSDCRSHDLSKITTDQQTFIAQKSEPNGCKTMKKWYWRVCGEEWDQAHS